MKWVETQLLCIGNSKRTLDLEVGSYPLNKMDDAVWNPQMFSYRSFTIETMKEER